ncbi:MAG TPA: MFS transporter [Myxococcales bacterium]|nr:MFS transporter [Myxococcales bacterium]
MTGEGFDPAPRPPVREENEGPSARYSYYVLALLTIMYTFNYLDRYVLTILVVPIQAELGLSDTTMGFLMGPAFAIFYTALGIPIARLADTHSRRMILSVSFVLWSVMTALAGLARTGLELTATRIGVGIGEAGGTAPAHSLISDYFPPERRTLGFGVFQQGVYLGQMLGLMVGAVLVAQVGWRMTFLIVGLPGVVLALVLYLTVKDPVRGAFDSAGPEEAQNSPLGEVFAHLWRRPSFRFLMIGSGIASFAGTGFGFWLPVLFERAHGMTPMEVGLQLGPTMAISGSLGAIGAGLLTDRLARRDRRWLMWIPGASVLTSLPFLIGVCVAPTATGALFYAIPSGLLGGGWAPAAYAAAQALAPPRMRALGASLLILCITLLGMGAGPQAVGILNDVLSPNFGEDAVRYSMVIVISSCAIGALLLLWGSRTFERDCRASQV